MGYVIAYLGVCLMVAAVIWVVRIRRGTPRQSDATSGPPPRESLSAALIEGDRLLPEALLWMNVLPHARKGDFLRLNLQRSGSKPLQAFLKADQDRSVTLLLARYGALSKALHSEKESHYCLRGGQLLVASEGNPGTLIITGYTTGDADTLLRQTSNPLLAIHNFHSLREDPSIRLLGIGTRLSAEWIKPWEMPTDFAESSGVADVAYSVQSAGANSARLDPEGRPGVLAPRVFYLLGSGNGDRLDFWFQRPVGLMAIATERHTSAESVYAEVLLRRLNRADNRDAALRWSRATDAAPPGAIVVDYVDGTKGTSAVQDLSHASVVMAFGTRGGGVVDVAHLSSSSRVTSDGCEHYVEIRNLPARGFSYVVVWLLE